MRDSPSLSSLTVKGAMTLSRPSAREPSIVSEGVNVTDSTTPAVAPYTYPVSREKTAGMIRTTTSRARLPSPLERAMPTQGPPPWGPVLAASWPSTGTGGRGGSTPRCSLGGCDCVLVASDELLCELVGFDFHRGVMACAVRPTTTLGQLQLPHES